MSLRIRRFGRTSLLASSFTLAVAVVACGGQDNGDGNGAGGAGGAGTDPFATDRDGSAGGGVGAVGAVTPGSACATSHARTTRPPAYLVFMYDQSKSMDDAVGNTTKWAACKLGLTNFFAAASSAGIHASLTFFGKDLNESTADCSATSYETPRVAMSALPNATAYAAAINATSPSTDTPTLAALTGAHTYAKKVKAGLKPNERVAVVLVTDGEPRGCNGNTVAAVQAVAAANKATVPTYVVGIGNVANLSAIATSGGTKAIQVSTTSPAQVTANLEAALGQIASAQLGCEYDLPAPPAGQKLDVNSVNVDYTPAGGAQTTLQYSADCADPNGWHYDNVSAPGRIITCPAICDRLKADKGGKMDIIFGCSTAVPPGGAPPAPK